MKDHLKTDAKSPVQGWPDTPDQVPGSNRNQWPDAVGISGRITPECAVERSVMDDLLSSAARLPDGTRVFRDASGNVRGEDGEIIR